MLNRTALVLPSYISQLFKKIALDMQNQGDDTLDDNELKLAAILVRHKIYDEEHSVAGWAHVMDRQDILDWLYQRAAQQLFVKDFLLHWAVLCRQSAPIIQSLIETDYQRYIRRYKDHSPLHIAVSESNPEMAALLISLSGNSSVKRRYHDSPIHLAVRENNIVMTAALIKAGANVNIAGRDGDIALHIAVSNYNLAIIKLILSTVTRYAFTQGHIGVNIYNHAGKTPLILAAENGNIDLIKFWLYQDANNCHRTYIPQEIINKSFRAAVIKGRAEAVDCILPRVDNIKKECTENPESALSIAAAAGNTDIVRSICRRRLHAYMTQRSKEPDFKRQFYFFFGYDKKQKIEAAQALDDVLSGNTETDSLKPHLGALGSGELNQIKKLIDKYCQINNEINYSIR